MRKRIPGSYTARPPFQRRGRVGKGTERGKGLRGDGEG